MTNNNLLLIKRGMDDLPFSPRFHFFTKSERHFSKVLAKLIFGKYIVLAKVKLQDAIYHPPVWNLKKEQRAWISKCERKHIDFLLCDRETTRPLVAIELDGDSHNSERQQKADADKSAILKAALLPLIRVEVRDEYQTGVLLATIEKAVDVHKKLTGWDGDQTQS